MFFKVLVVEVFEKKGYVSDDVSDMVDDYMVNVIVVCQVFIDEV